MAWHKNRAWSSVSSVLAWGVPHSWQSAIVSLISGGSDLGRALSHNLTCSTLLRFLPWLSLSWQSSHFVALGQSFCWSYWVGASVASVIVGPVEDHFGGFVVLPHLNICSEGASVVLCLSQVLLAGNKQEHGCILYLLVCLWSGFCQYEKLHLGQLVGLPSKLVSFFFTVCP